MTEMLYGIAMLGAFLLAIGGVWMWPRNRMRAILLWLVAAITLFNVWSWSTMPSPTIQPPPGVASADIP